MGEDHHQAAVQSAVVLPRQALQFPDNFLHTFAKVSIRWSHFSVASLATVTFSPTPDQSHVRVMLLEGLD